MTDYREHAPNNLEPYLQGRADQRRVERRVAVVCLILLAIYLVWGK